jgi:hypothetical protein
MVFGYQVFACGRARCCGQGQGFRPHCFCRSLSTGSAQAPEEYTPVLYPQGSDAPFVNPCSAFAVHPPGHAHSVSRNIPNCLAACARPCRTRYMSRSTINKATMTQKKARTMIAVCITPNATPLELAAIITYFLNRQETMIISKIV